MSEIKWIKISTEIFDDEKMKIIDAMPDRDSVFYIWIRLLVQAGKTNDNGLIYLNENISFSEEMFSTIFNRSIITIREAFDILTRYGMIEILENKRIRIVNWEKHQNVEGMERAREQSKLRMRRKRERDKKKLQENNDNNLNQNILEESNSYVTKNDSDVTVTNQNKRENSRREEIEDLDRDLDLEEDNSIDRENICEINSEALKILSYYEKVTGIIGVFNLSSLKLLLAQHDTRYVRLAIDKALQVGKGNMKYISGILRNWRSEGYPAMECEVYGKERGMLPISNESKEFKPQEPRRANDSEREKTEKELI